MRLKKQYLVELEPSSRLLFSDGFMKGPLGGDEGGGTGPPSSENHHCNERYSMY